MAIPKNGIGEVLPEETIRVKLLILGSGPAGLTAALYAARANLNPVVLTGMDLGGQVSLTYTVENYPGFPDGIGGTQLVELFQKQAEHFGAKIEYDTATDVDLSNRPFRVKTYQKLYSTDSIIVATGATPVHLNIPGESELIGRGVSYCATCDGWFFKDRDVVVVGGGDSALEEALFLTRYAKKVTIVHRRDSFRAGAILQERVKSHPKITIMMNFILTDIYGKTAVESVHLKNTLNGEEQIILTDGVFIFIGHTPNSQLFENQLELDSRGYIKTGLSLHTNIPGVFVAGEVGDPDYRQVVTSAGMGAGAAMQAIKFIEEHEKQTETYLTSG